VVVARVPCWEIIELVSGGVNQQTDAELRFFFFLQVLHCTNQSSFFSGVGPAY